MHCGWVFLFLLPILNVPGSMLHPYAATSLLGRACSIGIEQLGPLQVAPVSRAIDPGTEELHSTQQPLPQLHRRIRKYELTPTAVSSVAWLHVSAIPEEPLASSNAF